MATYRLQRILIAVLLGMSSSEGCMPEPGWVTPTETEQIEHAEFVFTGEVSSVAYPDGPNGDALATVTVNKIFCGCLQGEVNVTGLRSTALCGPGVPVPGAKAMFFACRSQDDRGSATELTANDFTLHTGMLEYTGAAPNAMMRPAVQQCGNTRFPDSCKDRGLDPQGRVCLRERRFDGRRCLDPVFACQNYGQCCGNGGYKLPGHQGACKLAKPNLLDCPRLYSHEAHGGEF